MSPPLLRPVFQANIEDPSEARSKSRRVSRQIRRNHLARLLAPSLNETPRPRFCFILKHTSRITAV